MRVKRVLSRILIVIVSLGVIAGTVWVLDFFAVISVYNTVYKIPVIGKVLPEKQNSKTRKPKVEKNPLEDENKRLAAEIEKLRKTTGELEKRLEVVNKEKQSLVDSKNGLQAALDSLQTLKDQQEGAKLSYEKLAKYYAEMKPASAVKIMENLSDEVNIGILQNLEDEQVAQILSAMDSTKAANLVDKMKQ